MGSDEGEVMGIRGKRYGRGSPDVGESRNMHV